MTAPSPLNFAFPRPFLRRRRQVREGRKERPRRRWRRLTSWAIGFWLAALFGAAAEERDPAVIACYDAEREIVTHTLPDLCRGEVISAEREAALAAARRLRIQSGVQETTADPVAGTRRLIGTGSGFYVGSGGELLTNAHVVDHCGLFTAASDDGDKLALHLVASDARQDLALLKADAPPPGIAAFSAAPGRSDGARLAVVGYPAYGLPTRLSTLSPARIDPIRLATASSSEARCGMATAAARCSTRRGMFSASSMRRSTRRRCSGRPIRSSPISASRSRGRPSCASLPPIPSPRSSPRGRSAA